MLIARKLVQVKRLRLSTFVLRPCPSTLVLRDLGLGLRKTKDRERQRTKVEGRNQSSGAILATSDCDARCPHGYRRPCFTRGTQNAPACTNPAPALENAGRRV